MRYIIFDNPTGTIWGDSASFGEAPVDMLDACRLLDESIGEHGRSYEEVDRFDFLNDSGYVVYEGADKLPVVKDGQNKDEIEAVLRDCQLLGFVAYGEMLA
jgi:hypothetical protein